MVFEHGENRHAAVAFPGADLAVVRVGRGFYRSGGRVHEEGPGDVHLASGTSRSDSPQRSEAARFPLEWGTFLDKR
jgi:hypothetical protein